MSTGSRSSAFVERWSGIPARFSVPFLLGALALMSGGIGTYLDIAEHIDSGRDKTSITVPHLFMLAGLLGISAAAALHGRMSGPSVEGETMFLGLRLAPGGVQALASGGLAAIGFPFDTAWHLLFGQDVTLWGPTHIFMMTGASFGMVGFWMLLAQGRAHASPRPLWRGHALMSGALLIGIAVYQAEFDYGVPQFQLVLQPVLIAFGAALVFVAAVFLSGRGGALKTLAIYFAIRGLYNFLVAVVAGGTWPDIPLFVVEAAGVELIALVAIRRPNRFVWLSGAFVGTFGLLAEWGWSQAAMPHQWSGDLVVRATPLVLLASLGGAALGARMAGAITRVTPAARVRPQISRRVTALAGAAVILSVAIGLPRTGGDGTRAAIHLEPTRPGWARAEVTLSRPGAASNADYFEVLSWQGHAHARIARMERIGPGRYRTDRPVPGFGSWKSVFRLARGSHLMSMPVYLPPEPRTGRRAEPFRDRAGALISDTFLLQREAHGGPTWLKAAAYSIIAVPIAMWLLMTSWSLRALEGTARARPPRVARVGSPIASKG